MVMPKITLSAPFPGKPFVGAALVSIGTMLAAGCAVDRISEGEALARDSVESASAAIPGGSETDALEQHLYAWPAYLDCDRNGRIDFIETGPTNFGFTPGAGPFPVEPRPLQVLSAELNGAGRDELLSVNNPRLSGDAAGAAASSTLSLVRGEWVDDDDRRSESIPLSNASAHRSVSGDLTENGKDDVAVLFYDKGPMFEMVPSSIPTLVVLSDEGDGTLVHLSTNEYSAGDSGDSLYAFLAADVDGDRDLDLFFTRRDKSDADAVVNRRAFDVVMFENLSDEDGDTLLHPQQPS